MNLLESVFVGVYIHKPYDPPPPPPPPPHPPPNGGGWGGVGGCYIIGNIDVEVGKFNLNDTLFL